MSEAEQRFSEKVPVLFTRRGAGRKVHQLDLWIPELARCRTRGEARRLVNKKARAKLGKMPGSKCCIKKAHPREIAAT